MHFMTYVLGAVTIGAAVYIAQNMSNKVQFDDYMVDVVNQPLKRHLITPHSRDIAHSDRRMKDKGELYANTDEIVQQLAEHHASASKWDDDNGALPYYRSDYSDYNSVNYDV
jgi:hypothetical protein